MTERDRISDTEERERGGGSWQTSEVCVGGGGERQIDRDRETQRDRDKERDRDTERETETERGTQRE